MYTAFLQITVSIKNILLAFIISIYMLVAKEKFLAQSVKITRALLPEHRAQKVIRFFRLVNRTLGGFIWGKILDSLIIGVLCFIGMSALRLPYTVLISVIGGVTNVIPYFGPFIGAIPSAILILFIDPLQALWFSCSSCFCSSSTATSSDPGFWGIHRPYLLLGHFRRHRLRRTVRVVGMFLGVPIFAVTMP